MDVIQAELSRTSDASTTSADSPTWLDYDFCPSANRYVYWLKNPLAQLSIGAIGSLAIGIWVVPQAYVALGGLLGVIVLGIAWPWLATASFGARLRFDRARAEEGHKVVAVLEIENLQPWPIWGLLLQGGLRRELPVESADLNRGELALECVPGWSKTEFRYEFQPDCRGEYPLSPPRIETEFPFGLWRAGRPIEVEQRLLVTPWTMQLAPAPAREGGNWSLGHFSPRQSGKDGEVLGSRPFRDGDSMRHVHWPQTARYDRLIVCERQRSQSAGIEIVLDLDPEIQAGSGSQGTAEWIIRIGASLARMALGNGFDAELVTRSGVVSPRHARWDAWAESLARLELPSESSANPVGGRSSKRPQRIVVSTTERKDGPDDRGPGDLLIRLDAGAWSMPVARGSSPKHPKDPGAGSSTKLTLHHPTTAANELRSGWERIVSHA